MFEELKEQIEQVEHADDVLAAEYAYYILLINLLRSTELKDITIAIEQLSATGACDVVSFKPNYLAQKKNIIEKMKSALTENKDRWQTITESTFSSVIKYIAENEWERCKREITRLKGKAKLSEVDMDDFIAQFVSYYAHTNLDDLVRALVFTKNELGPD